MLDFILQYGLAIIMFLLTIILIIKDKNPLTRQQPKLRTKEETVIEETVKPR